MNFQYRLIRSNRMTLAIQVKEGELIVRAPLYAPESKIREFLEQHKAWIEKHLAKAQERQEECANIPKLTRQELEELANQALAYIPGRVRYFAPIVGVTYGRITIRNQKTRWGSCSSQGNLNFNCLLMLAPPEVIDSVVVHELCHRLEMNHSPRFYEHVFRVMPKYKEAHAWLKKNGNALMQRGNI